MRRGNFLPACTCGVHAETGDQRFFVAGDGDLARIAPPVVIDRPAKQRRGVFIRVVRRGNSRGARPTVRAMSLVETISVGRPRPPRGARHAALHVDDHHLDAPVRWRAPAGKLPARDAVAHEDLVAVQQMPASVMPSAPRPSPGDEFGRPRPRRASPKAPARGRAPHVHRALAEHAQVRRGTHRRGRTEEYVGDSRPRASPPSVRKRGAKRVHQDIPVIVVHAHGRAVHRLTIMRSIPAGEAPCLSHRPWRFFGASLSVASVSSCAVNSRAASVRARARLPVRFCFRYRRRTGAPPSRGPRVFQRIAPPFPSATFFKSSTRWRPWSECAAAPPATSRRKFARRWCPRPRRTRRTRFALMRHGPMWQMRQQTPEVPKAQPCPARPSA